MAVTIAKHRFTVEDYHRMGRAGILGDDDRVELIEGEIVDMTPIGSRHAACVDALTRRFVVGCGERAIVRVQGPVRLGPLSEPQPDLSVLRPRPRGYSDAHPGPDDVLLLIEVADTSLDDDRTIKLALYARAGIPEVWVVSLAGERVDVYRDPTTDGYRATAAFIRGASWSPAAFPDLSIAADETLG